MKSTRASLILRHSLQILLFWTGLLSAPWAVANNFCSRVLLENEVRLAAVIPQGKALLPEQTEMLLKNGINPQHMTYLASGSEGHVFLHQKTQMVVKLFKSEFDFNNLLWLEENVSANLLAAGYKVASTLMADPRHLVIQHKMYEGMTLGKFSRHYLHKDPELWQSVFNQYRKIFRKLHKDLRSHPDFVDESSAGDRGYFDTLSGSFQGPQRAYLLLHEDNILVTEVSPGKFEFTVIDFH